MGRRAAPGGDGLTRAEDGPQPDVGEFRLAMGRFATGVTVVTTRTPQVSSAGSGSQTSETLGQHDLAITASSFASVSLDPLLVLVCVDRDGRFHDSVADHGQWGVSILAAGSRAAATWLATPGRPVHGQLERVPVHRGPATGVALLDDALATFECRTVGTHPAGDHSIVVGEVVTVEVSDHPGEALVHYRGRYESLG